MPPTNDSAASPDVQAARHRRTDAPRPAVDTAGMLRAAVALHQAGELEQAKSAYRDVLDSAPDDPDAMHLLGLLLSAQGDHEAAAALTGRAAEARPDVADLGFDHGVVLQAAGRPADAETAYRQVAERYPDHMKARYNLAVLLAAGARAEEAIGIYRGVLKVMPDFADGHYNLANALRATGNRPAAEAAYRRTIDLAPGHAGALNNLGMLLRSTGRLDDAVDCYRRALDAAGPCAEVCNNLGVALVEHGRPAEAEAAFRRAIEAEPTSARAHSNLGVALQDMGRLGDALAAHRRALDLDPDYGEAHNNLGNAWRDQGCIAEAMESYRAATRLMPDNAGAHSNLILAMNYVPETRTGEILAESRRWRARHGGTQPTGAPAFANAADPDRRLRIGYVSPDLRRHSVAYFLAPVLDAHDRTAVEISCYADVARPDDMTARLQASADHWHPCTGLPDSDLAARIREDEIDILVDLAGHTARNRLAVFAEKPAPVQVSWLGYPNTTGLDTIDYRLTDGIADPAGRSDAGYTESLHRLPNGFPVLRVRRGGLGQRTGGNPQCRRGDIWIVQSSC